MASSKAALSRRIPSVAPAGVVRVEVLGQPPPSGAQLVLVGTRLDPED